MCKRMPYVAVIACAIAWGGAGLAGAGEPIGGVVLQNGVEIHLPTPPQEKLRGADIRVDTWNASQPSGARAKQWVPGRPSQIRVADWTNSDPSRIPVKSWQPFAPSRISVSTWEPGRPSWMP